MMQQRKAFREYLTGDKYLIMPGAHDAVTAKIIEHVGFDAVYMTGAGVSMAQYGFPDIGLLTLSEMVTTASFIARAVKLPVICDADTGYGNALNVIRTVQEYERSGVAGIHIEDQTFPKRCGHFEGKTVIPAEEMCAKIQAACEARTDPDFVIIARTDARAPMGFDEAVKRGKLYLEAGADMIFPEALQTIDEFGKYAEQVQGLLLVNMTEYGKSPLLMPSELKSMGYKAQIFAGTALRAQVRATLELMEEIKMTGTQKGFLNRLEPRSTIHQMLNYAVWKKHEKKYVEEIHIPQ